MSEEQPEQNAQLWQWKDDVLDRGKYAEFLTRYLKRKVTDHEGNFSRSFTLALDAQWGQGKTFFIDAWKGSLDRASPPLLTMKFDAWKSDYMADPMVAFMAAFKAALEDKFSLGDAAMEGAKDAAHSAWAKMRKALWPASRVILKGLLRKGTGIACDEVIEACRDFPEATELAQAEEVRQVSLGALNRGLDVFFEEALEEQMDRQAIIADFKQAISSTLELLADDGEYSLPMYVFIDELDRCRPSFAIVMLEGIKHLFDIPGVCFVVSTNISQLSEVVKAVYGSGFDGNGYLKRFFDAEYGLPEARGLGYAHMLLQEHQNLSGNIELCFPVFGFKNEDVTAIPSCAFQWVAEDFALDLRSQRKVIEMISTASLGVPNGEPLHFLWMSILCVLRHRKPSLFELFESSRGSFEKVASRWGVVADKAGQRDFTIQINGESNNEVRKISLRDVAEYYLARTFEDLGKTGGHFNFAPGIRGFFHSVDQAIASEVPDGSDPYKECFPSFSKYFELVRTAGHFK